MGKGAEIIKAQTGEIAVPEDDGPLSLLVKGLNRELSVADGFIEDVAKTLEKSSGELAQAYEMSKKGYRLVVDASDELLDKINDGSIKLTTDKLGNTYAQINNAGKYGKKLPIKREDIGGDIDPVDAANSLQLKAIQNQLEDLACQISVIDGRVREVLQGQQNDRIALFESGMSLYLEAREIEDPQLRKLLVSQSQRALSDSIAQLSLEMKCSIAYLENGEYNKHKKKREELIREKMDSINRCFPIIHQASIGKAAIYCEQGETRAMLSSLKSYSELIEGTVGASAGLLAECDTLDDGTERGVWRSRAKLQLDVDGLSKAISAPEMVLCLEPVTDEDGENEIR